MKVYPKDNPWPNAANLFVPLIPTELNNMAARLVQTVFMQRLLVIRGQTAEAMQAQSEVERYYNGKFWEKGLLTTFDTLINLALRDGTVVAEVVWRKTTRKRKIVVMRPVVDPKTGKEILDTKTNEPVREPTVEEVEFTEYDDWEINPVEFRDILALPSWSISLGSAQAVCRARYWDEADIDARVAGSAGGTSGTFWKDACELALSYVVSGQNELPDDDIPVDTYTANDQISLDPSELAVMGDEDKIRIKRGPIKVWQVCTNAFDLDKDGVFEENILYVHDKSGILLGYEPYKYWHGERFFIELSLMPRFNRLNGFSVPERLAPLQTEMNANHNARLDQMSLRGSPPMYQLSGVKLLSNNEWGPGAKYEVTTKEDIGLIMLPDIYISSWQEEQSLLMMANMLTGIATPATAMQAQSGRSPNKSQVQSQQVDVGINLDLIASRLRAFVRRIFRQVHELELQFGPDDEEVAQIRQETPQRTVIEKSKLAENFLIDIAGNQGPLSPTTYRNETMTLFTLLSKIPQISGDPVKMYYLVRMVVEAFNRPDFELIIGTPEQAKSQAQQQAAMAAQAMQQQQQAQAQQQAQQQGHGVNPQRGAIPRASKGVAQAQ